MKLGNLGAALAAAVLTAGAAAGEEEPAMPRDLGGFEEDDDFADVEIDYEPMEEAGWWDLDGSVSVSSSFNYLQHSNAQGIEFSGLSRFRTRLNLELDVELPLDWTMRVSPYAWYDWAWLRNQSYYPKAFHDVYEWEVDTQDAYLEGPLAEGVDLKLGRQVVNWGRSDNLRVIDVLNPLDNREPGRADIEDLRRAIGMAKLDVSPRRNWIITAIAIPEIRFDDLPPFGSDFNPSPFPTPPEHVPDHFDGSEFGFSTMAIFEGWDVSFHFADFYQDFPRVRVVGLPPGPMLPPPVALVHERLFLFGSGANLTTGSWLFKVEIAGLDGLEFLGDDLSGMPGRDHWRLDTLGGIEYYGFDDTTLALEVVNRHLFDHSPAIRLNDQTREDQISYAVRYTAEWLRSRLDTTIVAIINGYDARDGTILRAQADYEIRDGLVFTSGILIFQAGKLSPIDSWGRNDRVFFDLKYSF